MGEELKKNMNPVRDTMNKNIRKAVARVSLVGIIIN